MAVKRSLTYHASIWHKRLAWVGGIALLIFAVSGLMHPILTWTGPKAVNFFSPQMALDADLINNMVSTLKQNRIEQALMVKVVPTEGGEPVLQITQGRGEAPRRYFDLSTGVELLHYDQKHATWLARYYTGLDEAPVKSITLQREFDASYPWVNRLIPVYRVVFDTEDERTAFIYTELGVLSGLTNHYKTAVQAFFRNFHTWSWLNDWEYARVFLMTCLLLSLMGLSATGLGLIGLLSNRKMAWGKKFHRIAAYIIWLPLLMFSISGIYHLLQYSLGEQLRGMHLGKPIQIVPEQLNVQGDFLEAYKGVKFNMLSLVEGKDGRLLYRLSMPQGKAQDKVSDKQRFDGVPLEKAVFYFDAHTGASSEVTDQEMAVYYASLHSEYDTESIVDTTLIRRFGVHYDFRNKRLPVWQIDYAPEIGEKLFIDTSSGMLVDRLVDEQRYESYSFSFLHKWNLISIFVGREVRDIIIALVLLLAIISTALGYKMLLRRVVPSRNALKR